MPGASGAQRPRRWSRRFVVGLLGVVVVGLCLLLAAAHVGLQLLRVVMADFGGDTAPSITVPAGLLAVRTGADGSEHS